MSEIMPIMLRSVLIALTATGLVALGGLPLAWLLARRRLPGHRWWEVAVSLPLVLPPTVIGYYLLVLLGRHGPVGWLTGASLLFTPAGAVLAAAAVSLPLFVQAARNAFADVDPDVLEAAQVDGASGWTRWWYIELPLAWPGIWTGALLAYARSLGEFGATLMVAGNIPGRTQTMALAIYSAVQAGRLDLANGLALILTAVGGITIWLSLRWRGRRP